jgi:uncharacterized protein YdeI (YjbR/CyaY-like superfamily)
MKEGRPAAAVRNPAKLPVPGRAAQLPRFEPGEEAPHGPEGPPTALAKNAKARAGWEAFPPSHRREYIEWITGAKQAETRARRLAKTIEQVASGKSQDWKYERK